MTSKHLPLVAASVAAALFSATVIFAQSAPPKPSPYQGISNPPPDTSITTSVETPLQPPPVAAKAAVAPKQAQTPENPDSMIVENPIPEQEEDGDAPVLRTRAKTLVNDPDAEIVTQLPGPPNALAEGTVFRVRLLQEVNAETALPGAPFRGVLTQNVMRHGEVVIPVGSELLGKVVYAYSSRRIAGRSVIHLRPDEFLLPDGTHYHLHGEVIDTQGSDTAVTYEGNIVSKVYSKRTLVELGVGSGAGAAAGAAIGGGVGAVVGTAVGAGIVTGQWLLENRSADLPAQSTVIFSLTDPMFLTPSRD